MSQSIIRTATISVVATAVVKFALQNLIDYISRWLSDREKAFFEHYKRKHPVKSPRVCEIENCVLIPPKSASSGQ